jgi:hypothetical protein
MVAVVLSVLVAGVGQGSGAGNKGCAMVVSDRANGSVLLMLTGQEERVEGRVGPCGGDVMCCVIVMLEGRVKDCLERGQIASGGCRVERGDWVRQRGAGGKATNCGNGVAVMQGANGTACG